MSFFSNQKKSLIDSVNNFILTSKSGYFEECKSETNILENNIDLSNFSILTNNYESFTEMSLNKSANVSKIVYCNEVLCQDKSNPPLIQDYSELLNIFQKFKQYYIIKTIDKSINNYQENIYFFI